MTGAICTFRQGRIADRTHEAQQYRASTHRRNQHREGSGPRRSFARLLGARTRRCSRLADPEARQFIERSQKIVKTFTIYRRKLKVDDVTEGRPVRVDETYIKLRSEWRYL